MLPRCFDCEVLPTDCLTLLLFLSTLSNRQFIWLRSGFDGACSGMHFSTPTRSKTDLVQFCFNMVFIAVVAGSGVDLE